ncbi:MAG: hypothetical protein NTZ50_10185 [Chloroflexi bacterium]|nr:hypothetical protein [Chloroflexota bacterium]
MGEVCIANIGPKQRRMRLGFGIVVGIVSVAFAAFIMLTGQPLWMRTLAFLPFSAAALGFFQYREKT